MTTPLRRFFVFPALLLVMPLLASPRAPRPLTFEARVEAQRAIERIYRAHRIGADPLAVLPEETIRSKVKTYLAQSEALASLWHTPLTPDALLRELARIRAHTQFPDRLEEIRRALGGDELLMAETLARATLADRLARHFLASDERIQPRRAPLQQTDGSDRPAPPPRVTWEEWWSKEGPRYEDAAMERALRTGRAERNPLPRESVPLDTLPSGSAIPDPEAAGAAAALQDVWAGGLPEAVPDARRDQTAVWTGSEMIIWGGQYVFYLNSGLRYDPLTDTWRPMSTVGAPAPRIEHTAIWTGREMIVWGGNGGGSSLATGGRYDPATDSWSPTSATGAPEPRRTHQAVWSGSEMIVWGGWGAAFFQTGGRYNPATDTWSPTSTVNAPSGRIEFAAVWTGTEMIVYGGFFTNTGGRYNPATDTWTPTSTADAPNPCLVPEAVWTGHEMVTWGGSAGGFPAPRGRYDPLTDTWRGISDAGAPLNRSNHTLVWTGREVIVWGGFDFSHSPPNYPVNTGGRYDPSTDTWALLSQVNAPSARGGHSAVWTGDRMVVWGGGYTMGGRYDPDADAWTPTNAQPKTLSDRADHTGIWTGSEMIIWGGSGSAGGSGARYDPLLDSWSPVSTIGAPSPRSLHTAVWTGEEMIVWGGRAPDFHRLGSGAGYDPSADSWRVISNLGSPPPRESHTAVWTGREMIVWGGGTDQGETSGGALYDPAADRWEPMSSLGAPSPREQHTAVWTGTEMIVWGGSDVGSTGGVYDPASNTWRATSTAGAPSGRFLHSAIWTGEEMIIWGGSGEGGARYDPDSDTWTPTSLTGAPSLRGGHSAVWTGSEMIIWGGAVGSYYFSQTYNNGARYDPQADDWAPMTGLNAPTPRFGHTALWTGSAMIVWGGSLLSGDTVFPAVNPYVPWYGSVVPVLPPDEDGDGWTAQEDCNDHDASMHPGALDMPGNTLDEDCNGTKACDPAAAWRDHGAFVSCVSRSCAAMVKEGAMRPQQCQAMRVKAARARIGRG